VFRSQFRVLQQGDEQQGRGGQRGSGCLLVAGAGAHDVACKPGDHQRHAEREEGRGAREVRCALCELVKPASMIRCATIDWILKGHAYQSTAGPGLRPPSTPELDELERTGHPINDCSSLEPRATVDTGRQLLDHRLLMGRRPVPSSVVRPGASGCGAPGRTGGIVAGRGGYTPPRRRKPNPARVSNRTSKTMMTIVSMSPPNVLVWVGWGAAGRVIRGRGRGARRRSCRSCA